MVRVPRDLDRALYHYSVLEEFLSVSDPTMILVVEPLESFLSAYQYSVRCPSLCSGRKTSVLFIRNHSFRLQIEGRLTFRDLSPVVLRTKNVNRLQLTVQRILTHQRNRKCSLSRKDRRTIFLRTTKTEGMRR